MSTGAGANLGSSVDDGGLNAGVHGGLAGGGNTAHSTSGLNAIVTASLIYAFGVTFFLGAGSGARNTLANAVGAVCLSAVGGCTRLLLVDGGALSGAFRALAVAAFTSGDSALLFARGLAS